MWIHALLVGWEEFSMVELVGYVCLLMGTLSFNDIISLPFPKLTSCWPCNRLLRRSQYSTIG